MQPEPPRQPQGLVPRLRRLVRSRLDSSGEDEGEAPAAGRRAVVERLRDALEQHDLDAMVACFDTDYRGEQPLHPTAGTVDLEQLRSNWETIIADVPDVRSELLDAAESPDAVWTEWRIWGTRRDGEPLDLRSVWIVGVRDGLIAWGRLYREPIHADEETSVAETVERLTRPQ